MIVLEKKRLDNLLLDKGLFPSREKAKSSIMAGLVFVDGQRVDKAGTLIDENALIELKGNLLPYVSRGGLKLEKAIKAFSLDLTGKVMMDVGASTGGFTDCALQNGAVRVYCIDVGYGQLAWSLRQDPRVTNFERTNIRYLEPEKILEKIDVVTIDVSFISLTKVLPKVYELLKTDGEVVALIKPQFEAGKGKVGKKGVVKDPKVHEEVITQVIENARGLGFVVVDLSYSPIRGPEGNIEYLSYLLKTDQTKDQELQEFNISELVKMAHQEFGKTP